MTGAERIDRVLFETTEFCTNDCYFCYGDYGPEGGHMSAARFALYFGNLIESGLLSPESLLILFGGEILNHPESMEICEIAAKLKGPAMNMVIITSGKYLDDYAENARALMERKDMFHHWEVSVKDTESFRFGLDLLEKGQRTLFRYDYLNPNDLKKCMNRFFLHVRSSGMGKEIGKHNRGLEKTLRRTRQEREPYALIVEELHIGRTCDGEVCDAGLVFSPLDQSVMRKSGKPSPATCSLFDAQYRSAVHVTRDGTLYPCHLPRFKKACRPLGNVTDLAFLNRYPLALNHFQDALAAWRKQQDQPVDLCDGGCKGMVDL